ncbi:hypothetical protein ABT56_00075 [Photobacterium aquae]|uniref:Uncharacterized protein n=1 Tax=Photobacterium aquae TaxID=1195763 RepID=A0A0J1HCV7_9GAMM|nr:hypothetical protein ABT56_00075 [Photobacterium aquae]
MTLIAPFGTSSSFLMRSIILLRHKIKWLTKNVIVFFQKTDFLSQQYQFPIPIKQIKDKITKKRLDSGNKFNKCSVIGLL